jgi:hypothetical protein
MTTLPAMKDTFGWGSYLRWCAGSGFALAFVALLFNVLVDPYGSNPLRIRFERPLMDINQRFMYPQVLRSGEFDSAVFGTSTTRLLSPADLEAEFGGHFANFGMNAATPFEQNEAARLYLTHTPKVRTLIWGMDEHWCEKDADAPEKRLTERAFPPWLYGGSAWASIPHLFNLRTLEIASRVVLNRLGLMKARLPRDGYEVFTPPEGSYDLARVRRYIAQARELRSLGNVRPHPMPTASPGADAGAAERSSWRYPGLDRLTATLAALPQATRLIMLFPPAHMVVLPSPGSYDEAREAECKRRLADIARAHQGIVVDFRFASPITTRDDDFWDPLHYRLPIAKRIVEALHQAVDGESEADDFRVIAAEP